MGRSLARARRHALRVGQVPVRSNPMDAQTAYERKDDVIFVDVREPYEWAAGHIEGSLHIPIMELPSRTAEIPTDRTIVCVCQIGQRSELTARFLQQNGYEAHNLEGGMADWHSRGLPFVTAGGTPGEVVDGRARDFDGPI